MNTCPAVPRRPVLPVMGIGFFLACLSATQAEVVRVEVEERRAFADGRPFGSTGPYESMEGRPHFAVDPEDPANERVTDIGLAPRNDAGKVEFSSDFFLLKPADPARGNRRILYPL